jgi:hypothetical protein
MKLKILASALCLSSLFLSTASYTDDAVSIGKVTYVCSTRCEVRFLLGEPFVYDCCGGRVRIISSGDERG